MYDVYIDVYQHILDRCDIFGLVTEAQNVVVSQNVNRTTVAYSRLPYSL